MLCLLQGKLPTEGRTFKAELGAQRGWMILRNIIFMFFINNLFSKNSAMQMLMG